jgi:hypothetical protein
MNAAADCMSRYNFELFLWNFISVRHDPRAKLSGFLPKTTSYRVFQPKIDIFGSNITLTFNINLTSKISDRLHGYRNHWRDFLPHGHYCLRLLPLVRAIGLGSADPHPLRPRNRRRSLPEAAIVCSVLDCECKPEFWVHF